MRNPETAKRLSEAMSRKNLTAKELSDKSGVSESSISQYLHGLFAPKNKTAAKLADVLCVNPMWLMGFDVAMAPPSDPRGLINSILDGKQVVMDVRPNHAFIMDMDDLTKDMSKDQMERIKLFTQFLIQEEKSKKPEEDKKPDDDKKSDE